MQLATKLPVPDTHSYPTHFDTHARGEEDSVKNMQKATFKNPPPAQPPSLTHIDSY